MEWYVQLPLGILTSLAAAYFGTRLALSRFKSERWFEKRYQAVCELLESINIAVLFPHNIRIIERFEERVAGDKWKEELKSKGDVLKAANQTITRVMGVRYFLLPYEVNEVLDELYSRDHALLTALGRDPNGEAYPLAREKLLAEMYPRIAATARSSLGGDGGVCRCLMARFWPKWRWLRAVTDQLCLTRPSVPYNPPSA